MAGKSSGVGGETSRETLKASTLLSSAKKGHGHGVRKILV